MDTVTSLSWVEFYVYHIPPFFHFSPCVRLKNEKKHTTMRIFRVKRRVKSIVVKGIFSVLKYAVEQ